MFHINGIARRVALSIRRRSLRTAFLGSIRVAACVCEVCNDHRRHSALRAHGRGVPEQCCAFLTAPVAWTPEEGTRFKQERWGRQGNV